MKDIKTREHDRKPKVLEKASRMPKELAKEPGLRLRKNLSRDPEYPMQRTIRIPRPGMLVIKWKAY